MPRVTSKGVPWPSATPSPQITKLSNACQHLVITLRSSQPRYWPQLNGAPSTGKLQEPFPVPLVPRWLRTPKSIQTTMPIRGELLLIPMGAHFEDIRVRCPAVWAWMAVLLQYWQDHMTCHLYRGHFRQTSDLAATLIQDINPWLPHKSRFGWGYVAMHATLWLDLRDQFVEEHVEEWEAQKCQMGTLNDLERDTEVIHRARILKRQEDKVIADSKEAATKELPPERQAAHMERQAGATPMKADMTSTSTGAALYPDWIMRSKTKPIGHDTPRQYRTPKEDTGGASRWRRNWMRLPCSTPCNWLHSQANRTPSTALHQIPP